MSDYPELVTTFPDQVQCILLKNSSVTSSSNTSDSDDPFPYSTKGFKDVDESLYMFFNHADDLKNLDIVNGQCRNTTFAQNVTFGEQNLPFSAAGMVTAPEWWRSIGLGMSLVLMMMAALS